MIKWLKKLVFGVLILLGIALVFGMTYEQISRINADQNLPAHGELVDVGGHKLHFYKQGTTGPTVVFESAFDPAGHLQWFNIQKHLSGYATTVSYDRAGLLWSERGQNPKTSKAMARELYTLLEKANVAKPYILIGHSLGGVILRSFVADYQQDVAGVILVDSKHPNEQKYMSQELYDMTNEGLPGGFLKFANAVGLLRPMFAGAFPDTQEYDYLNSLIPALLYKSAYAILEEQAQMPKLYEEARKISSFGDIPLIVMSATDRDRFDALFNDDKLKFELIDALTQMQLDLLNLSTQSEQILVPNSGHYINEDQPEAIINAVKKMILKTKG
jgi:pimeloyl-ACP methyl ester carboxylesterase